MQGSVVGLVASTSGGNLTADMAVGDAAELRVMQAGAGWRSILPMWPPQVDVAARLVGNMDLFGRRTRTFSHW